MFAQIILGHYPIACSGGIFIGDTRGQLGQYHKNDFVKIRITYPF
jgi:hypothetical protein